VGLLRYAATNVLRGRRRTLSAIMGVLLAVTFIAGTFIAIDSSTRATLDGLLAGQPVDILFSGPVANTNATQVRQAVEGVPGVDDVAMLSYSYITEINSFAVPDPIGVQVVGVEPDHLPIILKDMTITAGSFALPRGSVALSTDLASALTASVGTNVSFQFTSFGQGGNRTVTRVNVTVAALFDGVSPDSGLYLQPPALVHVRDVDWYAQQLSIPYASELYGEVRVNRAGLIDPYDLPGSQRNLARLSRQVDEALAPFGARVNNDFLSNSFSSFAGLIAIQRIIYLALSFPVVLLGVYLGAIGVDLSHAERRRELAVLKTRGATRRQLLGVLLLEAALGGMIASIVGLVAGLALSRLLLNVVNPFGSTSATRYDLLALSPSTVATVIVLSVIFMAGTSYRSARRTASLPIVETLRYYAPGETRIHYRPTLDVCLVVLSIVTYGMVLYAQANRDDFVTFLIGTLFFVILPFTPVFLIVGTTRLLTRSTGRVYEWTSRACKPFAKNLYYVISRNLQRNPRRSANVAVIIALGLAFGMFILVTFSSQLAYQERQVRASIGADIAIDNPPFDPMFAANLSLLPEVAVATQVRTLYAQPQYGFASVYALDPATFFSVTNPESWYFRAIGVDEARQVLVTPGHVLVTEAYLENAFLEIGDRLRLEAFVRTGSGEPQMVVVNTTIGGTVRGLPGTDLFTFGIPTAIYGSLETLGPLIGTEPFSGTGSDRYLVDLRAGADWRTAEAGILDLGASGVRIADEQVEALRSNPVFRALFGFMELEMAFMVVILTAGLGLILYAATLERDVELAAIRARGASGWQTVGLLVGEASSIMLIGLAVGAGIGTFAAYLSTTLVAAGPGGSGESLIPLVFMIPIEALLLLALAPAAMIVTSFAVSLRVAKMDIARVLKLRGG